MVFLKVYNTLLLRYTTKSTLFAKLLDLNNSLFYFRLYDTSYLLSLGEIASTLSIIYTIWVYLLLLSHAY